MRRRSLTIVIVLLWFGTSGVNGLSLISVQQEIEIGKQAQEEVRRQVPELRDGMIDAYIGALGRRLAAHANGPRYPYSFDVANYKEINAFALPGGPVWVHRGTIDAARNEAQLASVMAHEIAHIAQRHAASQITKGTMANVGLGILGAILGDGTGSQIARIGAQVAAGATMSKFSRDDEREADLVGLQIMKRAGYDPRGAAEFMAILREEAGRNPSRVEVFFASHPAPGERVDRLNAEARRLGASGRRDSNEFRNVQVRLDRLGPAESMRASAR